MEMQNDHKYISIPAALRAAAEAAAEGPETVWLVILSGYLLANMLELVHWVYPWDGYARLAAQSLNMVNVWLISLYPVWLLLTRFRTWQAFLASGLILALNAFLAPRTSFSQAAFLTPLFLLPASIGKHGGKIRGCFLWVTLGILAAGICGQLPGISSERSKFEKYGTGLSLGMLHPNTLARLVMLVLLLIWYRYLRKRPRLTLALFWTGALFAFAVCQCRTVTLILLAFPVPAWIAERRTEGRSRVTGRKWWQVLMTAMPFLCLALTLLLASQPELLQKTKGSVFYNMISRFVQAAVALRHYGFPLLGVPVDTMGGVSMRLAGTREYLRILDNAYVVVLLQEGALYTAALLGWLCFVNRRCLQRRDYRMLLIANMMLVFALMEKAGLTAFYNFAMFTPLAKEGLTDDHLL